jgi:glutamyl-tRNA reductase
MSIAIVNRTVPRARARALEIGASAHGYEALPQLLASADLLISAVGSGRPAVDAREVQAALGRNGRSLLIIDIGVPPDVDPDVRRIPGVTLYELGDLRQIVDENIGSRRSAIPAVESIVAAHARDYMRWYQSRAAVPLIANLRRRADEIRVAELEKLFARNPDLGERQREAIRATSVSIINKLLHVPLTRLRETVAEQPDVASEAALLEELFDLAHIEEQIGRQFTAALRPPAP